MSESSIVKLIVAGVASILVMVGLIWAFDIHVVAGNEIAVRETWSSGVDPEPYPPKTYFLLPWERMINYPTSVQTFVMNDRVQEDEHGEGRRQDSYLVQSADSQDMHLSLQLQWRIDPAKVVNFHRWVGMEKNGGPSTDRGLRPTLMRVVKDEATVIKAMDAYSGAGLVTLQQSIEKGLVNTDSELSKLGIVVDSFVIEHIKLDPDYVKEISARQVAVQRELRAVQEEKTAVAEAAKAKAESQKLYEQELVIAKTKKEVAIANAETEQQKTILQAEAEAKKTVLAANAKRESAEAEAASIEALGKATAESERLKFSAYSAPGADVYARIEVAKSLGASLSGIRGYLPENMNVYTLGDSFMSAVENVIKPKVIGVK